MAARVPSNVQVHGLQKVKPMSSPTNDPVHEGPWKNPAACVSHVADIQVQVQDGWQCLQAFSPEVNKGSCLSGPHAGPPEITPAAIPMRCPPQTQCCNALSSR